MSGTIADYLATDDLTILLGLISATLFLLNNLYKPQPLVHPILLGRQSDVARVRNPGESAVYRNYSTGLMGRVRHIFCVQACESPTFYLNLVITYQFPVRPNKDTHILSDILKPESEATRTLWTTRVREHPHQGCFGTMSFYTQHNFIDHKQPNPRSCRSFWYRTPSSC